MTAARAHASVDVVIVGGGHNGLVAAAYLAQAGRSVLLLERSDHLGGAAVSAQAFSGVDARLSRYSYLVSLLPRRIIEELGLSVELVRRRYSSYTPDPRSPGRGLLVDTADRRATRASFEQVGAASDYPNWKNLAEDTSRLAHTVFATMCEPLPTRSEMRRMIGDEQVWSDFFERPLGETLEQRFDSDLVRGVAATDALIGTFTALDDPALDANRCFLYHVIGNETGDWDVPVGGMGAVSGELERAARLAGAELVTGAEVTAVSPGGLVRYRTDAGEQLLVRGEVVLANVAPYVLRSLLAADPATRSAAPGPAAAPVGTAAAEWARPGRVGTTDHAHAAAARPLGDTRPEGAQVKVNLMVSRLPRLLDPAVAPEAAFGGTFHINELYSQLESAYRAAVRGVIPEHIPCEIYCHTLSDPSILSPELAASGAHTLTVFALHQPDRWLNPANNDATRARLQSAVLASLNSVLGEPIEDLLLTDAEGRPCIETKTTLDLERELGMPGGNIFHGPLEWPFLEDDEPHTTTAERWGVATEHPRILLCGSGARRGGAVSGIGGHNAAMAVLEAAG